MLWWNISTWKLMVLFQYSTRELPLRPRLIQAEVAVLILGVLNIHMIIILDCFLLWVS